MIRLRSVAKIYPHLAGDVQALVDVSLEIGAGEFVALIGPSGSGKTTLLNVIGTLDGATRGTVEVGGHTLEGLREADLLRLRRDVIGFVFQDACLVPSLTVAENARLPRTFSRRTGGDSHIDGLLQRVGLGDRTAHLPSELSAGEQQRAAIARALANWPKILLADEPTGHLDSRTGQEIGKLLLELNGDLGLTVILATHNEYLAGVATRQIHLSDGRITTDTPGQP